MNTNWSNDPNKTQVDWTKVATINNKATLKVPFSQIVTYEVKENGIVEVTDTIDQYGDSIYAHKKMILSKEAFIEAYNAYIRDDEIKRLEKSNKNWRRKCQRLRNEKINQ